MNKDNLFWGSEKFYKQGRIGLSAVLIVSLLLASGGFLQSFFVNNVNAAALAQVKATLSTSAPDASSSMTIQFVTPTGVSSTVYKTLTI